MSLKNIDQSFLGSGWSFPPTFRREWFGLELLTGVDDVESCIRIILETISGERVMLPSFGSNLQAYFFEPMNVPSITMIEKIVHDALVYHEPRIIVENVSSTPDVAQGILAINIEYTIITTNTRYNYVYPFYMTEATNIETK
ncbi:MAG: GPW/gp25 family protein [Niabella sp.]|nr:GPW/gp25 family protein [Niabella sp.]